jgi:hypothetical protein
MVTSKGEMGLASIRVEPGDLLLFFPGGSLPFILHQKAADIESLQRGQDRLYTPMRNYYSQSSKEGG